MAALEEKKMEETVMGSGHNGPESKKIKWGVIGSWVFTKKAFSPLEPKPPWHQYFNMSQQPISYQLQHFTPKVLDFDLARTAMDEENRHISTRVMEAFGYVALKSAMTGHLLVKSDVYSYGVVLLELITGRKSVDMSQPPSQENLVSWAHPFLTSKEGLVAIIDPSLGPDIPFDSMAKVAANASMCVQPEASRQPCMGEVVQALKLVCNECDREKEAGSRSSSQELSIDMDTTVSGGITHNSNTLTHGLARKLEQEEELDLVLGLAKKMSVSSVIGVRTKLRTKHSGQFGSTSGEKGKFGLTMTQILRMVKKLEQSSMLDCLQLLHFHIGS